MTDVNATLICAAADKAAADALAAEYPGGEGTFSVALTTNADGSGAYTHYCGSGYVNGDMVDAFNRSVLPIYKVMPLDGTDFFSQLASCTPPLYLATS